ncbi:hypothetical protein HGD80_03535 [Paulownia witches'-broom phytoplasma]|uniref:Uncharacterized protein n=1 Tax=Paulownia witches'-broom phytoplasma TaxID=39647 RepID=A0ABX8TPX0_9MOLU|nr:hypothetical protein [Paulownia witches'-broom phytoplasma]QYC30838.1 hypothetical protein HGD80_03535 [Paulownia witches'-broom phytoplasma]GLH60537.1 hypothetical protein PAWBP_2750 [Paulownia witches'-broom phytoplasma]GLH60917.1 hypothetical protein PAWBP_6550 [Paulownia witches'-broom phytoplasma]
MAIVIKKKCQNGNNYFYFFSNGKIKTIHKDGTIIWKTKRIFKTKKNNKRP